MVASCALAAAMLCGAPVAAQSGGYGDRQPLCRTNPGSLSFELGDATITAVSDGFNNIALSYLFVDSIPVIERVIQCAPPPPPAPLLPRLRPHRAPIPPVSNLSSLVRVKPLL